MTLLVTNIEKPANPSILTRDLHLFPAIRGIPDESLSLIAKRQTL